MSDDDLRFIEGLARVDDARLAILTSRPAVEALFGTITAEPSTCVPVRQERGCRLPRRSPQFQRRAVGALVVAVAGAMVLLLGILGVIGSSGPVRAHATTTGWKLAGYVTGWTENTTALDRGGLSCPDTTTCYVTGPSGTVTSGWAPINSLWVSRDSGASWNGPNLLPSGITFTTPLVCSTEDDCLAGGRPPAMAGGASAALVLHTSDGGRTWSQSPLPSGVGLLSAISCPSSTTCFGLADSAAVASALGIEPQYGPGAQPTRFLATTDGGQTWSASPLPANDTIRVLDCPTPTTCVAGGEEYPTVPTESASPTGVVLTTADGGGTWTSSTSSAGLSEPTALACPTASDCYAIGSTTATVPTPADSCTPGKASCTTPAGSTARVVRTSEFYRSSDGGTTWESVPFPTSPSAVDVFQLTCPTASQCWVSGQGWASGHEGLAENSPTVSPVVLTTNNDGTTWATMTPPDVTTSDNITPTTPALAALQCPASDDCVALTMGVPAWHVPALIFTYRGPGT